MDTITRRRFLLASGVTCAGTLVAGAAAISAKELTGHAERNPLPADAQVLVLVTLYGGNDGLNTVIPYGDPAYHDARPDMSYDDGEVLKLSDGLGLNPALKGLSSVWKDEQLAIVRGVGYPKPDFSHFKSMDIWQTGSPSTPVQSGWLGRWLDATGDDPVRAVNIGSVLAPAAVGTRCTAAALDPGGRGRLAPALGSAVAGLGVAATGTGSTESASDGVVRTSYRNERTVDKTFASVLGPAPTAGTTAGKKGGKNGARVGGHSGQSSNALAQQLDFVGKCVKSGVPTRAYLVSLGGFDTHANEKATQQQLLSTFDTAVSGFLKDMAGDPRGKQVVVMAYSEFGRRVAANAADGTDHGTAGPMFVAGAPVRGGFYGEQPSLKDLDDGNMKSTVDFRAVYGEVLHKVLATDPAKVLDTVPKELGFLT